VKFSVTHEDGDSPANRCGTVAAFSMSNRPRATATNCLLPLARLGWRGSFQRSSTRPIARGRRESGLRSRTRKLIILSK
jgi:hypothetical protein